MSPRLAGALARLLSDEPLTHGLAEPSTGRSRTLPREGEGAVEEIASEIEALRTS